MTAVVYVGVYMYVPIYPISVAQHVPIYPISVAQILSTYWHTISADSNMRSCA